MLFCDSCPRAFCRKCLLRNLGRKVFAEVMKSDEWKCIVCEPAQIFTQKAFYYALFIHQEELAAKKAVKKDEAPKRTNLKGRVAIKKLTKELTSTSSGSKTFIDDILVDAFKVSSRFHRSLEKRRKRWMKANREPELEPELALTITLKLKKILSKTSTNMLQLDESLTTSFKEKFPELVVSIFDTNQFLTGVQIPTKLCSNSNSQNIFWLNKV